MNEIQTIYIISIFSILKYLHHGPLVINLRRRRFREFIFDSQFFDLLAEIVRFYTGKPFL